MADEARRLRAMHGVLMAAVWHAAGNGGLRVPPHVLSLEGKTIISNKDAEGHLIILREKPASIEVPGAVPTKTAVEGLKEEIARLSGELEASVHYHSSYTSAIDEALGHPRECQGDLQEEHVSAIQRLKADVERLKEYAAKVARGDH